MARIPDKRENQRRFAELDTQHRRAIVRAVNRGEPVGVRKHAVLAVGLAERQQRFWRLAWLMGPALGVVQAFAVDPMVGLVNGLLATFGIAVVSWWFYSRARRAELLNREIAEGRKAPGPRPKPSGGSTDAGAGTSRWRVWERFTRRGASSAPAGGSTNDGAAGRGDDGSGGGDRHRPARGTGGGHLPHASGRLPGSRGAGSGGGAGGKASGDASADGSTEGGPAGDGGSQGGSGRDTPPVDPQRVPPGQRPYQPRRRKRRRR